MVVIRTKFIYHESKVNKDILDLFTSAMGLVVVVVVVVVVCSF